MDTTTNGFVHVFTGEAKEKTLSPVGLRVSFGSVLKVRCASNHKRHKEYGYSEIKKLEIPGTTIME